MRALYLVGILASAVSLPVVAQVPSAAQSAQRNRMKICNADAGSQKLAGDARKGFMAECLAGKTAPAQELTPQQAKMKSCNADASAKSLKGAERKGFMSTCLKG